MANNSNNDDLQRLRAEYAKREDRLSTSDLYSPFNPAHLYTLQSRQRASLALLRQHGYFPLQDLRLLELGCGSGGVLHEYLGIGVAPTHLHGTDLIYNRVHQAHERLPHLPLICADGRFLPYPQKSFDLVLQYTVLSSILDDVIKSDIASEMVRVLKPCGVILWYDFWLNPTNPHARGIRPAEVRRLFPGCHFIFRRITLAPPIARRLVPLSWLACAFLEKLRIFNTHYLVAIRPDH